MYRRGLPSNRSITTLFFLLLTKISTHSCERRRRRSQTPAWSLSFFSLTLSKPPWHDQLARYHYCTYSAVLCHPIVKSSWGLEKASRPLVFSFFAAVVAVPLLFSLSVGTGTYRTRLCLPVFQLYSRCLCSARHRARTGTSREPESH
ncbi:hypothetical protein GGI43DRAFT_84314 [Trichoderma evansii]